MFDIGFLELLVVAIVALLVIGPERLPETIRKVLSVTRAVKRSLHNARMDVEREMGMDDIRRQLHNEEILRSLNAPQEAIDAVIRETQTTATQLKQDTIAAIEHCAGHQSADNPLAEKNTATAGNDRQAIPRQGNAPDRTSGGVAHSPAVLRAGIAINRTRLYAVCVTIAHLVCDAAAAGTGTTGTTDCHRHDFSFPHTIQVIALRCRDGNDAIYAVPDLGVYCAWSVPK
jgi:sec-independent protein translocase protein TatB